jgi:hypothetical protein
MSIFKRKRCELWSLVSEKRGLLAKRQKEPIFCRKIPGIGKPFSKNEKRSDTEEISI